LARLSEKTVSAFNGRDVLSENDREPSKSNPREQTNGLTAGKFHCGFRHRQMQCRADQFIFAGIRRDTSRPRGL
jgi:hypothetical protein